MRNSMAFALLAAISILPGCGLVGSSKAPPPTAIDKPSTTSIPSSDSTVRMSKEEADAARGISLADIDAENPMAAEDLKKKFTANPSEWKGKKVSVTGTFSMYMTSSSVLDGSSSYRTQVKGADKEPAVACLSKAKPKEWEATQNRKDPRKAIVFVFKGVVVDVNLDHVVLEPCEIVSVVER